MKRSVFIVLAAFLMAVSGSAAAQSTHESAAAVYQHGAGLWIVADIFMGDPDCYTATISQAGENLYHVAVDSHMRPGIVCNMAMGIHPVARLFEVSSRPDHVRIAIGSGEPAVYSVGASDVQP